MPYKIVGISGSPIKEGNTDTFLSTIMDSAEEKGLQTDIVNLSNMTIKNCIHCNFCLSKQKTGNYCSLKDDTQLIYEKLESADIIILASPVYFMRTSGMMATFIDRLRVFIFGNIAGGKLRNKIGISAGVSWLRHGGMETMHLSHICAFITLDMIPATIHSSISPLGASAVSSRHGEGVFEPKIRLGVNEDQAGIKSGEAQLSRALELVELIHK
ncbi:MAG: flavodoxin family protein [Deltaproteobacteria bacterium]|uniref:flavodoxin family protein n=1 Tax=Desulfobacula sp. TaxID=2593537 RepID=UPI0019C0FB0C|nr:flavodoxin family protein [Candidatus Desulfobacula maris]MBL6994228.1 flavodoxin family protein [Desulfobacula sp.]